MPAYDTWTVTNTHHDPHTLGQWNSVCAISNGYLGLKGNLAEERDGYSPVTLINGVYDELDMFGQVRASNEERPYLDPCYFDTAGKSPAIANLPNPLLVQVFLDEREVSLTRGGISGFQQTFDLTCGLYRYQFEYRDGLGRTTRIEMERFASLTHAHRIFMRYSITPLDHDHTPIRVHSGISGHVYANPTGERQFRVTELWADPPQRCRMAVSTPARKHEVRLGVVNVLRRGQPEADPTGVAEHDAVYTRYAFSARRGETITLERYVALTCSEDLPHRVVADPETELDAAVEQGFDAALEEQRAAWRELWERCDVQIDGDDPAQLGLRFCLYHLLAAGPRFTDRLSVPIKLLTGEYYQGSTFYDTDLCIVPFYAFTLPELARTCLDFRYQGLRPGREIARELGYEGIKFPWQAGPDGEECLGKWWRFTHTNVHVNADVAYALMQYVWATGDERYLCERGIDLLVETARFYAARAVHDESRDRYDLRDVAGPDEGHCQSTNNFYTNYLAIRNLRWAADALRRLEQTDPQAHAAAVRRLAVRPAESDKWRHVADRLTLVLDPQTQVYEQCDGFHRLKPVPADLLDNRKVWFTPVFPYQALNQPDVVMALVLFRDEFGREVRRANWNFYKDKSMNFSSVSFAVNAIMAADVGEMDQAYRSFIVSAGQDLDEALTGRKDTHAGLHGTACGGAWMAAVFGFGGVCLSEKGLRIEPNLPPQWSGLRFNLVLHGVVVNVAIDREQVVLKVGHGRRGGIPITVAGKALTLEGGQTHTFSYRG